MDIAHEPPRAATPSGDPHPRPSEPRIRSWVGVDGWQYLHRTWSSDPGLRPFAVESEDQPGMVIVEADGRRRRVGLDEAKRVGG